MNVTAPLDLTLFIYASEIRKCRNVVGFTNDVSLSNFDKAAKSNVFKNDIVVFIYGSCRIIGITL